MEKQKIKTKRRNDHRYLSPSRINPLIHGVPGPGWAAKNPKIKKIQREKNTLYYKDKEYKDYENKADVRFIYTFLKSKYPF